MAGLRGKALILNLPGKPKAIRETIDEARAVFAYLTCCFAKQLLDLCLSWSDIPEHLLDSWHAPEVE
jgi:molybdopterin biosynthesis enzyme MoaB